jgi:serine/threonine-protein kinase
MMQFVKFCPVCSSEFAAGAIHCPDDGVTLVAVRASAKSNPEALIGTLVDGRYRVERILGKGGMGTVYACRHVVVGKTVAMKVLSPSADETEELVQRFLREAKMAGLLKSRHIVEINDFGQLPNGLFFVVMELLEGQDLACALRAGHLARAELIHVFIQVAETLALAHDRGIVHRDLKPDNVFLVPDGSDPLFVKILDFGIAKLLHDNPVDLTETGVILGTPYYMSPEQARGDAVDHRTDIYALGVMMYRAFAGRLPFIGDSKLGVLTRHLMELPQPPSQVADVDPTTERLILCCLEKEREHRPPSMRDLAAELREMLLDERCRQGLPTYDNAGSNARRADRTVTAPMAIPAPPPAAPPPPGDDSSDARAAPPPSSAKAMASTPAKGAGPAPSTPLDPLAAEAPPSSPTSPQGVHDPEASSEAMTLLRLLQANLGVTEPGFSRSNVASASPRRNVVVFIGAFVGFACIGMVGALLFAGRAHWPAATPDIPASAIAQPKEPVIPASAIAAASTSAAIPAPPPPSSAGAILASAPAPSAALPSGRPKPPSSRSGSAPAKPAASTPPRRSTGEIRSPFD